MTSLSTTTLVEGATSLTANGGNFVAGATVVLNGNPLPTTWVNSGTLQATLPSGLEEGSAYQVAVANPLPGGGGSGPLPLAISDAPLALAAQTISADEGGLFTGAVATLSDGGAAEPAANYTAVIDWGDGNSSQATLVPAAGGFNVMASHTYEEEGAYQATTTVVDDGGATATAAATVSVGDATLSAVGKSVSFTEGALLSRTVASFEDTDPKSAAGDFTATVYWGDGQSSAGSIVADGALFDVVATHQYSEEANNLPISVFIQDAGGAVAKAPGSASIALSAKSVSLAVTGNKQFSGTVADFTDAGLSPANDFTATIVWGDTPIPTAGAIKRGRGVGNYIVTGSHTYSPFNGASAVVVTITDADSGVVTVVTDPLIDPLTDPAPTPAATPNQLYVLNAYQSAFGSAGATATVVAGASLANWAAKLDAGAARSSFATAMLHSDEYYGLIVDTVYQKYLGHATDAAGLSYWVGRMRQGTTDEQIEAGFAGAEEFYQHAGGSDAGWVAAMYLDILGRAADAGGLAYWTAQLAQGANRAAVAHGFAAGAEREAQRVGDDYFTDLGRAADAAGETYWVNAFERGMRNEDVIAGFLASDEYYSQHSS